MIGPYRRDAAGGPAEAAEGAGDEDSCSAGKTEEEEAPAAISAETQGVPHRLRAGIHKLW